jgi:carboxylesterase type B
VKETTHFGNRAVQPDLFWKWNDWMTGRENVATSEDCLFLNIFLPALSSTPNEEKYPVMVFVHGGGHHMCSTVELGDIGIAQSLVIHGVIIVTIQYRLGALGFFSTGDEVCPGNLGLWDQAFALRWVQDNIAAFGGDKSKVTVFGQSSGGVCVDLLALSPHSRGTGIDNIFILIQTRL